MNIVLYSISNFGDSEPHWKFYILEMPEPDTAE